MSDGLGEEEMVEVTEVMERGKKGRLAVQSGRELCASGSDMTHVDTLASSSV